MKIASNKWNSFQETFQFNVPLAHWKRILTLLRGDGIFINTIILIQLAIAVVYSRGTYFFPTPNNSVKSAPMDVNLKVTVHWWSCKTKIVNTFCNLLKQKPKIISSSIIHVHHLLSSYETIWICENWAKLLKILYHSTVNT